jgi:3D (Asp-Asp-Asp) domain-containing protein
MKTIRLLNYISGSCLLLAAGKLCWTPADPPLAEKPRPALVRLKLPPRDLPESLPDVRLRKVSARVTACSPHDPQDREYYRKNGYEGRRSQAVAADPRVLPKGTMLLVPGYQEGLVPVDSKGGSTIRRSTRKGITHIDVKVQSYAEAKRWGNQLITIFILEKA